MKNNLEIGNRIRVVRESMHLTRDKFSEKIGISEVFLSQIERGEKSLSLNTLISICENTGCNADYLLFGEIEDNAVVQKTLRILTPLPPEVCDTMYEIMNSVKQVYEKNHEQ